MTLLSVKMVFHKGTMSKTKCMQKCVKLRYFTVFFYSIEGPYCTISIERFDAQVSDLALVVSYSFPITCCGSIRYTCTNFSSFDKSNNTSTIKYHLFCMAFQLRPKLWLNIFKFYQFNKV